MSKRLAFILIAVTIAASMGRIVFNDFTGWDDPHTITDNPAFNPPTVAHIAHYWTSWGTGEAGLFVPFTYTAWGLLAFVGRASDGSWHAWPFHLTSLLAHVASGWLVFLILTRLVKDQTAAIFGALLFALHPLQVESVAWAAGLKDVLAGMFGLLALHEHLAATEASRDARKHHAIAFVAFAFAMLCKPSAATILPIAVVIDLLIRKKPPQQIAITIGPALLVLIPLLIVARHVQDIGKLPDYSLAKRCIIAGDALAFYIIKLFAPLRLGFDYGRTPELVLENSKAWLAGLLPISVLIAASFFRSRLALAACFIFIAGLSLNLGLSTFQFQFYSTVADHYVYLAMLGPALLTALILQNRGRRAYLFAGIILLALSVQTFLQAGVWKNTRTLSYHAIEVNHDSAAAQGNLGNALGEAGEFAAAEIQFHEALRLKPLDPLSRRSLALIAIKEDRIDDAIRWLGESIALREAGGADANEVAHDRLELIRRLASRERWPEVVEQLRIAEVRDPTNASIQSMLQTAISKMQTPATQSR